MVPEGSWIDVPRDHVIIGLKDLPESDGITAASCVPHAHLSSANFTPYQPPSIIHTFSLGIATKTRKAGTAIFLALHAGAARSMTSSSSRTYPGIASPRSGPLLASLAQ